MILAPLVLPEPENKVNFSAIDPFDARYFDPQISKYLSERSRIAYQAYIEAALAHTLADYGVCSRKVAKEIEKAARAIKIEEVYEEEKVTKHDVKALVNTIKSHISTEAKPYVHFSATSYDIVATASALQMRDAVNNVVIPRLKTLLQTLINLTEHYADTTQIGRTHGQHALPITFGFALAEYVSRLGSSLEVIQEQAGKLTGKFSGAVGAYNASSMFVPDPLEFERKVLAYLGLEPAQYSTQIIPAENILRVLDELSIAAGIMANLGNDMRHLQRSEIAEVREKFEPGQTGSSTMAHKRNPWNFENVVSMSKQVTAQIVNARANISSEHQRDLTDSAAARFYTLVPAGVASMAERLNRVMNKLEVDEDNMRRNLMMSEGAIAAEPLYLLFAKYGHQTAHEKSKELSQLALSKNIPLKEVIEKDKEASKYWQVFTEQEQQIILEPELFYTGIASKKAKLVASYWHNKLKQSVPK